METSEETERFGGKAIVVRMLISEVFFTKIILLFQVKVTPEHNAECKTLLKLMGIPYLDVS